MEEKIKDLELLCLVGLAQVERDRIDAEKEFKEVLSYWENNADPDLDYYDYKDAERLVEEMGDFYKSCCEKESYYKKLFNEVYYPGEVKA